MNPSQGSISFLSFIVALLFTVTDLSLSGSCQISDITLRQDGSTILLCDYRGAAMSWRYYSNVFDDTGDVVSRGIDVETRFRGRFFVVYNTTVYGLVIQQAQLSDTGIFKCAYYTSLVSTTVLHVLPVRSPTCTVWSPDFAHEPIQQGKVNQNVILTCESGVENNYPEIRWFRDGNETELDLSTQGNTLRTPTTIVQQDKDVPFRCVVGTGDPASLPSCSVIPFASKPIANISPLTARGNVGEMVTFTCTGSTKHGDVNITWDPNTLLQFNGRYATNDSELVIRNLKSTDHEASVVCIVRANSVGTEEVCTATILVTEYSNTSKTDGIKDITNDENLVESSGLGVMVGLIVAVLLALMLVTLMMFVFMRRNKNRQKSSSSDLKQRGKVDNYDDISVHGTKLSADDGVVEYAVDGSVMFQRKEDQNDENDGTYASVNENGDIESGSTGAGSNDYEQTNKLNEIPEYYAGDQTADDENLPVYAEVNKRGSKRESNHQPREISHAAISYDEYAQVMEEKKSTDIVNEIEPKTIANDSDYAQVDKKTKTKSKIFEDGYAKPDLHNNDVGHGEVGDPDPKNSVDSGPKRQAAAPKYAKVVKDKGVTQKEVFEEVYAEPDMNIQRDHNDGNEVNHDFENGDILANETEPEYAVAGVSNDRGEMAGYSKPDLNISIAPEDTQPESGGLASPLYAEVQNNGDDHSAPAQDDASDSNKNEKPKYAKVNKTTKK